MNFPNLVPNKDEGYGVITYRIFVVTVLSFCAWQATETLGEIKTTTKLANTLNSRLDAQADRLVELGSRVGRLENPYFHRQGTP